MLHVLSPSSIPSPTTAPPCLAAGWSPQDTPLLWGSPEAAQSSRRRSLTRAAPGRSPVPMLGAGAARDALTRQGRTPPVPAAAPRVHAPTPGCTHFGVGVWEAELIQTVLPRVQQAAYGQGPVSAGDGQAEAAEWAARPLPPGTSGQCPGSTRGGREHAPLPAHQPPCITRSRPALTRAAVAASAACPSTCGGTSVPSRPRPQIPAGWPRHASLPAEDGRSAKPPRPPHARRRRGSPWRRAHRLPGPCAGGPPRGRGNGVTAVPALGSDLYR